MVLKFSHLNESIERSLFETVRDSFGPDDIIFVLTATLNQVLGIRNWYSSLANPKPRIVIQFMHHPWYQGLDSDPDYCASLLSHAMAAWKNDGDLRVTFAADNDLLANFLHKASGFPIRILPMPMQYPDLTPVPGQSGSGRVRFGSLGNGRIEKGLHHFIKAILAQAPEPIPNAEFFIHISSPNGRDVRNILQNVSNCTVLCEQLSGNEYWNAVKCCDVIVLPYDPKHYLIRGSGVLFEAMGLEKPIIATEGSCLDWLMAKYGAPGMRFDFTAESLLDAVRTIANNFADFKAATPLSGGNVREKHNPKAFVDALLPE